MDHQLLDTARDYFHFVTSFFEVINVSATHIYHSALELSPLSSIIRRFYYHQRPHPSPRVIVGTLGSWDLSTTAHTNHPRLLSSVWSPCGQFVATAAVGAVEIRDAHTLEVLSTPQPTQVGTKFRRGLAYSPDGCSLAGCSDTAVVVWDTQTGGMVRAIEWEVPADGLELVWSSDGTTIGTTISGVSPVTKIVTVYAYDVASGASRSLGTFHSKDKPYFWAHDTSFRIATTERVQDDGWRINIFQIGSALAKIESFLLRLHPNPGALSPTTYRLSVSVAGGAELRVLDLHTSEVLLRETDLHLNHTFSPDGSFFAAFAKGRLVVWKYTSGRYARWRDFQQTPVSLQFSPTLSSILGCSSALLHVLRLDDSPSAVAIQRITPTRGLLRDAYYPHGTYIATARRGGMTITTTDLRPQNPFPSQFIDTNFEISKIVLTGNVLLAEGFHTVVAWLLTDGGTVSGIFGNRRANHSSSLWEMSLPDCLEFSVKDGIAAVRSLHGFGIRIYNAETGEILEPDKTPLHPGRTWYQFRSLFPDDCDNYHHGLGKNRESDWLVSQVALREGWVKDPEGKHRLWLHAHWRSKFDKVDWLDKVTTIRLKSLSELVIIKF